MTETGKLRKPSPKEVENEVNRMHERGVTDADILQAMAVIAEQQGNSTLARRLANTAQELLEQSQ